jgi:hypothetical protein
MRLAGESFGRPLFRVFPGRKKRVYNFARAAAAHLGCRGCRRQIGAGGNLLWSHGILSQGLAVAIDEKAASELVPSMHDARQP